MTQTAHILRDGSELEQKSLYYILLINLVKHTYAKAGNETRRAISIVRSIVHWSFLMRLDASSDVI